MSNLQIKLNYLHTILSIIHSPTVLEATLKEFNINFPITSDTYTTLIDLLSEKHIDIDKLLSSLVENNIDFLNQTLTHID